jgi:pyruvate/2-oxoglutarate dehydrogenase complex dihydrolipoamide dehydrogenase (E3) component
VEKHGDKIAVNLDCRSGDKAVIGSHLLVAVGRVPNTDDLGLEKTGVSVDQRGYIQVDDQLRTNVPGIYALGDCNGRGAFTHKQEQIMAGNRAYSVYGSPQAGAPNSGFSQT